MTQLITVNTVEGSHQTLVKTNTTPSQIKTGVRRSIPLIKQHITYEPDINKAQPTVFHPPYQTKPDNPNLIQGVSLTKPMNE